MAEASHSVFLSYASQDAEAAGTLCEALRAAGITVWHDQSELRGGDVWDQRIRQQIRDCTLFLPVISQNTQTRTEGYFRLEWRLADQRTHLMGRSRAFLVPVCVDATREADADVPDSFFASQWTRLPGGHAPPIFVERVRVLLSQGAAASGRAPAVAAPAAPLAAHPSPARRPWKAALLAIAGLAVLAAGYELVARWVGGRTPATVAPAFSPPAHSVAVLPFTNMSGDKEQDYFSDGLTEELLNSLARINALQVAARTSAFSFKGKDVNVGTIARELNVGSILEGSVRRSGHTVRITAQLINAVSGFQLWSESYDRDLGDVLKLQTEIASAVAGALKVTLLETAGGKAAGGGTHDPAAFDAYLRALAMARNFRSVSMMDCRGPVDAFSEAIALDPEFALAYAHRALFAWTCATNSADWLSLQSGTNQVRADAERTIALAPELAEGHLALASLEEGLLRFGAADRACGRALALAPGSAQVLGRCSLLAAYLGHADAAAAGARHAVELDPLDPNSHRMLGDTLRYARRYEAAIAAYRDAIAVDPEHSLDTYGLRGLTYYSSGKLSEAKASCETYRDDYRSRVCLSIVYDRLGQHADAAKIFAALRQEAGDASAYQYTEIYAQRGEREVALGWLEKALKLRDPGLAYTKSDPLLDPLRGEARFQAVMHALEFPD